MQKGVFTTEAQSPQRGKAEEGKGRARGPTRRRGLGSGNVGPASSRCAAGKAERRLHHRGTESTEGGAEEGKGRERDPTRRRGLGSGNQQRPRAGRERPHARRERPRARPVRRSPHVRRRTLHVQRENAGGTLAGAAAERGDLGLLGSVSRTYCAVSNLIGRVSTTEPRETTIETPFQSLKQLLQRLNLEAQRQKQLLQ